MRRVDVADPTPEGKLIADALRARDIAVFERSVESLRDGSDAAVVVLAGDADGARETLTVFAGLEDAATAPVLVVGSPLHDPFDTDVAIELGADAFYARPVPIERLVRKVVALLELLMPAPPDEVEPGPEADAIDASEGLEAEHDVSQVLVVVRPEVSEVLARPPAPAPASLPLSAPEASPVPPPPILGDVSLGGWRPPERTIQLTEGGGVARPPSDAPSGTPASDASVPSTSVGAGPPTVRPSAPIAELSPELARMLLAADRRVFPTQPPIDLAFAASHEPPEVLVPAELLEPGGQVDPIEDDPLDAFTWVGQRDGTMSPALTPGPPPSQPPPATPQSQGPTPRSVAPVTPGTARPPRPDVPVNAAQGPPTPPAPPPAPLPRVDVTIPRRTSHPPPARARGAARPADDQLLGEPTEHGAGRRGILADAGVLPLLARIVEQQLDVEVTLTLQPELTLTLVLVAGELRALDGPAALRVVETLRRERRAQESPRDESDAAAILERRVQGGLLDRFELDRRLARARESLLHDAVGARAGAFVIEPLDGLAIDAARVAAPVLGGPLIESMVEGARRRFDPRRARQLLGRDPVAVALSADAQPRLAQLRIAPELASLILRHDGAPLDTLLGAASPGEGLPGLLLALSALGIVETRPLAVAPPSAAELVRSAREIVRSMASLADDGDYFAILGLEPSAGARDAEAAWTDRRRELERLELDALGLDELAPLRDAVLEVLDEAHDVLCDDGLRERYRSALGLGQAS